MYMKNFSQEDFAQTIKLWPANFSLHRPIFAGTTRSGRLNTVKKISTPLHLHILNPECVRIPLIPAPKSFPVENFSGTECFAQNSLFRRFLCTGKKEMLQARYAQF